MAADHNGPEHPADPTDASSDRLASMNALLADWAACSAAESEQLIDRFETMGYEVRGKTKEEVAEVLKHPPTRSSKP